MKTTPIALPHVLLIVTDQVRHDAYHPDITPNLHSLARQPCSTTFSHAYASTPSCTPSRSALLTGKSPWNHGMLGYAPATSCTKYASTLPSVLSIFGYQTYVAGKNHFGSYKNNNSYITQGYENLQLYEGGVMTIDDDYQAFFEKFMPGRDPLSTCGLGWNDWQACPYVFDEYVHPTAWTTRTAIQFLDDFDFSSQHMFLKVSYHRPHSPYDPPKRLYRKYMDQNSTGKPYERFVNNTSWDKIYYQNETAMPHDAWHGDPGIQKAARSRAGYLANVEFVDEGVGQILDWLRDHRHGEQQLLNRFFIIWTSDHGDMNGDHNLWRKGYPWEASAHIPMVIKLPAPGPSESKVIPAQTSDALVENRDLAPTIYQKLGILDSVRKRDPLMNGKSLLGILKGEENVVRNFLDLEHNVVYNETIHWNALVGYIDGSDVLWKYIFHSFSGEEQLFRLTDDPDETYDLAQVVAWQSTLKGWRERLMKQFEQEGRGEDWVKDGKLVLRKHSTTYGDLFPCKKHDVDGHIHLRSTATSSFL